ncbi:L domain-like protein [Rhizoclosmatium globosum]|uniref:L domain-like protein n=1 Tax=Rhizoclosmatium globosum TaxID=329046 RepID=A0A1Y2C5A4_9FUNG|nr:L domain-like protein [Rhizoclosmatium globosum]|eukprot:ORY42054.1 L domain-like protein [Rhizoclosmatium globosum]
MKKPHLFLLFASATAIVIPGNLKNNSVLFDGLHPRDSVPVSECEILHTAWPDVFPDDDDTSCLSAPGITAENSLITKISLPSLVGIQGPIPDLGSFQALTYLDLSKTGVTGPFPTLPPTIQYISLKKAANFDGSIPDLSSFQDLTYLSLLEVFGIEDELPDFTPFESLVYLELSDTQLYGPFPNLPPQLKYLLVYTLASDIDDSNVCDLSLTGSVPKFPPALIELHLYGNSELTGPIPAFPEQISHIEIARNKMTGELPELKTTITSLNIHGNHLSGEVPKELPPNLTKLWLYENMFSGHLPNIPQSIVSLKLHRNLFNGKVPDDWKDENLFLIDLNCFENSLARGLKLNPLCPNSTTSVTISAPLSTSASSEWTSTATLSLTSETTMSTLLTSSIIDESSASTGSLTFSTVSSTPTLFISSETSRVPSASPSLTIKRIPLADTITSTSPSTVTTMKVTSTLISSTLSTVEAINSSYTIQSTSTISTGTNTQSTSKPTITAEASCPYMKPSDQLLGIAKSSSLSSVGSTVNYNSEAASTIGTLIKLVPETLMQMGAVQNAQIFQVFTVIPGKAVTFPGAQFSDGFKSLASVASFDSTVCSVVYDTTTLPDGSGYHSATSLMALSKVNGLLSNCLPIRRD